MWMRESAWPFPGRCRQQRTSRCCLPAARAAGSGKPILAVTFATRLHPQGDTAEAEALARSLDAMHRIIEIDEFSDSRIVANPKNRCYLCKSLLFRSLLQTGQEAGYTFFCEGSNVDDTKVYRPASGPSVKPASTVRSSTAG